jgi:hypothetical protein
MEAVTIHPPEGYEVCPTSTQTEIRFRPIVKSKPTWEDLKNVTGYWVKGNCHVEYADQKAQIDNRNVWPTKEEAEAALALSQLCQWRDKYNEGWKPDWTDSNTKWLIQLCRNKIATYSTNVVSSVLVFKTGEIRDKFLEDFAELIETAKPLL